jgi:vancomycin resistance protein YoaR
VTVDSPEAHPEPAPPRSRGRRIGLVGAGRVLVLAAAYVATALGTGDQLPRDTRVAGVSVGGMTRDEAVDAVRQGAPRQVSVTVDGATDEVDAEEAGLSLDAEASVDQAGGGSRWSPVTLWHRWAGGDDVEPVVEVDDEQLAAYVASLTEEIGEAPVDGVVRLTAKGVRVREPEAGTGVDEDQAREALVAAYQRDEPAELPTSDLEPEIDADDVAEGEAFAEQALSGPVTIGFEGTAVDLQPEQFARALELRPEGGALVPHLRAHALHRELAGLVAPEGQAPVDATVRLRGDTPQVVAAKPGVTYDVAQVDAAFLDLVTQDDGARTLEVDATVSEPEVTTADAEAWKIVEQVSEFTTYFPYAEYRNTNIGRAAELVDGTVVPPGETFSLNQTVGERTAENGFTDGFIISNGIFKEDLGGGVSQMATTTFNAGFFAGMTDVEHKPHSFYIDRYPVGREATVAWPTVDMQFKNDTPYGVLVHATLQDSTPSSQGVLTVSIWSTKYWDITTKTSDRYAFTSPATRTLDTPDCYANTGYGGFDVDVWRYWRRAGSDDLERTEKMHTTYTPSDTVICKPPPQPEQPQDG